MLRWTVRRGRWHWIYGVRQGEWWIGARRNFPAQAIEINVLGLTLMVARDRP